ncbi:hypothetical protein EJ08DRAFT_557761, partial [Tothia fuscella]
KAVVKLESPYTTPNWPHLNHAEQENILNLLCHFLSPIGQHRKFHIIPSKGKRSKKRKRTEIEIPANTNPEGVLLEDDDKISPSPTPELRNFITVGFNSTSRHLESMISPNVTTEEKSPQAPKSKQTTKLLAAIFLTAASTNYLPYSHLPTLASLASSTHPESPAIRLVQLGNTSESKLSEALGIPRIGIIGVFEDAPNAAPLMGYVREHVEAVNVPWTKDVGKGNWLGTRIS